MINAYDASQGHHGSGVVTQGKKVYNKYVRKKAKSRDEKTDLVPIWFQFSSRFYRRLAASAEECRLSPAEVVKRGIRLVVKQHREKLAQITQKTPVGLSVLRWLNVPPEERSRISREMARKRWDQSIKSKRR